MTIEYGNESYDVEEVLNGYLITFPDGAIHLLKLEQDQNQETIFTFENPFPGADELATIFGDKIMQQL